MKSSGNSSSKMTRPCCGCVLILNCYGSDKWTCSRQITCGSFNCTRTATSSHKYCVCARDCVCVYVFVCLFICMKAGGRTDVRACVRACHVCIRVCDCLHATLRMKVCLHLVVTDGSNGGFMQANAITKAFRG